MTDIPHFAFPFRFAFDGATTRVVVNEQDSYDDVFDCCHLICCYYKTERIEDQEFGITDQTFRRTFDIERLKTDIEDAEPRAAAAIEARPDEFDALVQRVQARISTRGEA